MTRRVRAARARVRSADLARWCACGVLGLAVGVVGGLGAPDLAWAQAAPAASMAVASPVGEQDAEPPPKQEKPMSAWQPHRIGTALFDVEVGFELSGRWFRYSDGITANLRPYSVFGAPTVAIAGEVYPLAWMNLRAPVIKDLGIQLAFVRAFALESATDGPASAESPSTSTESDEPIDTTYQRLSAGLRLRYRLGLGGGSGSPTAPARAPEAPLVGLSGGLQLLQFSFNATPELAPEVPDVSYLLLWIGVDGRVPLGPIALAAKLEYLGPLRTGDVYERFKGPSVAGIEVGGGLLVPLTEGVEVRVIGEYTRFFSSFSPEVGDPYVAGGALDHFLGVRLAAAYVY